MSIFSQELVGTEELLGLSLIEECDMGAFVDTEDPLCRIQVYKGGAWKYVTCTDIFELVDTRESETLWYFDGDEVLEMVGYLRGLGYDVRVIYID